MSIIKRWRSIFKPIQFQGWGKKRQYFEGWYYKVISKDGNHAFAFIPGIALDNNGKGHSFIQVLDGKKCTAKYHTFPIESFTPDPADFNVNINENSFSTSHITLDLDNIKGQLQFTNNVPWPNAWYSPGIMGPFSFVPFMQCYHGIVSMDHDIEGSLKYADAEIDFTGGKGYMEKDWGRSFPSAYIWMQSNHFSKPGISFKSSVANIPWLGSSFVGCIAGVWLGDQLIQFTTYNFTKLLKSYADKEKVLLQMENNRHRLEVEAFREQATELASPIQGFMDGRIEESMTSKIHVSVYDKKKKVYVLNDTGINAGLEVAGSIDEIMI